MLASHSETNVSSVIAMRAPSGAPCDGARLGYPLASVFGGLGFRERRERRARTRVDDDHVTVELERGARPVGSHPEAHRAPRYRGESAHVARSQIPQRSAVVGPERDALRVSAKAMELTVCVREQDPRRHVVYVDAIAPDGHAACARRPAERECPGVLDAFDMRLTRLGDGLRRDRRTRGRGRARRPRSALDGGRREHDRLRLGLTTRHQRQACGDAEQDRSYAHW